MGEDIELKKTTLAQASEAAMVVDTMGGRMHVRWDETAQATPHGQIVFFAEFLATAGVFDRWVQLPAAIQQPQLIATARCAGHADAGYPGGALRRSPVSWAPMHLRMSRNLLEAGQRRAGLLHVPECPQFWAALIQHFARHASLSSGGSKRQRALHTAGRAGPPKGPMFQPPPQPCRGSPLAQ
jgi:hypothetical protein